jgi:NADH:ubiquinone oxidoreductase subunit 2 (subunit N)
MAVATGLALLYYVRAIHRVWLGKPAEAAQSSRESALAKAVLLILIILMLAVGLFPGWLTGLMG